MGEQESPGISPEPSSQSAAIPPVEKPAEESPPTSSPAVSESSPQSVAAASAAANAAQGASDTTLPPKPPIAVVEEQRAAAKASALSDARAFATGETSSAGDSGGVKNGTGTAQADGKDEAGGTATPQDQGGMSNSDAAGVPLRETTYEYWENLSHDERKASWDAIDLYFHTLLEDFRQNANAAVKSYIRYGKHHTVWRIILIIATGTLAIVNVLAAQKSTTGPMTIFGLELSLVAAVYATVLALLTNLESFLNYPEKKTSTRESRELYLDAYRNFEMMRLTQVYPYGYTAKACFNFSELYRRLVVKDLELRRKIMQLSTARTGEGRGGT